MSLQSSDKKKIINGVEKNLPEFIEKEKLIIKIKEVLDDIVYNNITKNELEYYKLYPTKCRTGLYININDIKFEIDDADFPRLINYDNPDYYRKLIKISFPGTINDIVNIYYNKSFWKELKSSDINSFLLLKDLIKNFINLSIKTHNKISYLKDVLDLQDMSLTNLKNYYPELYKIVKQ